MGKEVEYNYYVGKRVMVMDVPGKRRRGRWMNSIKHDFTEKGLSGKDAQDRAAFWATTPKH